VSWIKELSQAVANAICRARGGRGTPDPKLEALLAHHAQKLKEKRKIVHG